MNSPNDFIELLERSIFVAENIARDRGGTEDNWMVSMAHEAIEQFRRIAHEARSGILPSSEGVNLGITRNLGEWAPKELYDAGKKAEDYYQNYWK
jgi:hypothetical protein